MVGIDAENGKETLAPQAREGQPGLSRVDIMGDGASDSHAIRNQGACRLQVWSPGLQPALRPNVLCLRRQYIFMRSPPLTVRQSPAFGENGQTYCPVGAGGSARATAGPGYLKENDRRACLKKDVGV